VARAAGLGGLRVPCPVDGLAIEVRSAKTVDSIEIQNALIICRSAGFRWHIHIRLVEGAFVSSRRSFLAGPITKTIPDSEIAGWKGVVHLDRR
jgi:hypothetical protein